MAHLEKHPRYAGKAGMTVCYPEQKLEQGMTGRQSHFPSLVWFQPDTIKRRELGLVLISLTSHLIWSKPFCW